MKHNSLFYFSDYNTVALMIYFFQNTLLEKLSLMTCQCLVQDLIHCTDYNKKKSIEYKKNKLKCNQDLRYRYRYRYIFRHIKFGLYLFIDRPED